MTFRDWLLNSEKTPWIAASPLLPSEILETLQGVVGSEPLLWMATSGTTSSETGAARPRKWLAHSREAILSSAKSVCDWLTVTSEDHWAQILPTHHMGGLMIDARAAVSQCQVIRKTEKWNADAVVSWMSQEKITLISLVPTQVFDCVQRQLHPPRSLRAAIVGADRLSPELTQQARALGWPILRSFGMTETASMIACEKTSSLGSSSPGLPVLPHARVAEEEGFLKIESPSLFSAEAHWNDQQQRYDLLARPPGAWITEDRVNIISGPETQLIPLGRDQDYVKIFGEGINLRDLDDRVQALLRSRGLGGEAVFGTTPDDRQGVRLVLYVTEDCPELLELWNSGCLPFERASEQKRVSSLPRTELGKLKRSQLR